MKKYYFIIVFSIFVFHACNNDSLKSEKRNPEQIVFPGVGDHGIFDPSLAKNPSGSRIWMSYSEVDDYPYNDLNFAINSRLAYSDNNGADWTDSGIIVNQSEPLATDPTYIQYNWEHEVSSICYDPGAPENERWKIIWHRYLCFNNNRLFMHGWIGMKTAPSPDGTWSAERKLFTGSIYDSEDDDSIIGEPEVKLNELDPDLEGCMTFSEPSLFAADSALYCCLLGAEGATDGRIILLKYPHSTGIWEYCGTFLVNSIDGQSSGYEGFSAPNIYRKGDVCFLMATPQISDKYLGIFIFEISDLDTAELKRKNGSLVIAKKISGRPDSHNGAGGYIQESYGSGIIYSDVLVTVPLDFRIYKSFVNP